MARRYRLGLPERFAHALHDNGNEILVVSTPFDEILHTEARLYRDRHPDCVVVISNQQGRVTYRYNANGSEDYLGV